MFSAKKQITEINMSNRMIQAGADFGAEPLVRFGEVHRGIAPPTDRNLCEQMKTTSKYITNTSKRRPAGRCASKFGFSFSLQ